MSENNYTNNAADNDAEVTCGYTASDANNSCDNNFVFPTNSIEIYAATGFVLNTEDFLSYIELGEA